MTKLMIVTGLPEKKKYYMCDDTTNVDSLTDYEDGFNQCLDELQTKELVVNKEELKIIVMMEHLMVSREDAIHNLTVKGGNNSYSQALEGTIEHVERITNVVAKKIESGELFK